MYTEYLIIGAKSTLVYTTALFLIRLTNKRILGDLTPFDFLVTILIGSVLSRSINGSAPFLPSLFAVIIIIFLHWLTCVLLYHFKFFKWLVRGKHTTLVKNGKIDWDEMKNAHISKNDLLVELRKRTGKESLDSIKLATMETSGSISFVYKE